MYFGTRVYPEEGEYVKEHSVYSQILIRMYG